MQEVEALNTKIDKKTVNRLVDQLVDQSLAKNVAVFTSSTTSHRLVRVEALVKGGVPLDSTIKEKVRSSLPNSPCRFFSKTPRTSELFKCNQVVSSDVVERTSWDSAIPTL